MPQLFGFDTWVEIGGVRQQEFKPEASPLERKVVCWVPCETGKEFRVGYTIPYDRHNGSHFVFSINLDGRFIDTPTSIIYKNTNPAAYNPFLAATGLTKYLDKEYLEVEGVPVARPFVFGSIELTDDERYLNAPSQAFGEIVVSVYSVEAFIQGQKEMKPKVEGDQYKMHERSKKGLAHCVQYGQAKPLPQKMVYFQGQGVRKVATFIFKYRSMDILIADGIAPPQARSRSTTLRCQVKSEPISASSSGPSTSQNTPRQAGSSRWASARVKVEVKEDNLSRSRSETLDEEDTGNEPEVIDMTGDDESVAAQISALRRKGKRRARDNAGPPAKRIKTESETSSRGIGSSEVIDLTL